MLNKSRLTKLSLLVPLLALAIVLPLLIANTYVMQCLILMLMYGFLATGWNIIGGFAGQMALGNGVYFGIGAYVSGALLVFNGISPWFGMLIGGLIAALVSLALGSMTFRLSGVYYALSTIALLNIIRLIFMSFRNILGYNTNGALGLHIVWTGESAINMQFEGKAGYYYSILLLFIIGIIVAYLVKNSRMGYYLAAISTNESAAGSLGVNVMGMKLKAGAVSAFLTAMGGAFYAMFAMLIDPAFVLGFDISIVIVMYAVIGGRSTILGPALAAFLLSPLNNLVNAWLGSKVSGLSLVIYSTVMMLMVFFAPAGIWPWLCKKIQDKQLAKGERKQSEQKSACDDERRV